MVVQSCLKVSNTSALSLSLCKNQKLVIYILRGGGVAFFKGTKDPPDIEQRIYALVSQAERKGVEE